MLLLLNPNFYLCRFQKYQTSMFKALSSKEKSISVIGLGYVGLPLALELAKKFRVIGFDISAERVAMMNVGQDPSEELETAAFLNKDIVFTASAEDLSAAHFHIVAVPTPVDDHRVPDLTALKMASITVGKALKKGDYVIYESTVYPGATEEDCLPLLEANSGLSFAADDFKLGYSPERINPGDKERTIDKILKIVSGSDAEALEEIAQVYGAVITAGIYKAPSIKVAEAAKVIENTQRDINISFMNELSIIFDRMGIDTNEVLDAAGTKWNFLRFSPGLVGGHCISVDPYYLLYKSKELGYDPQVILSGRRVNDAMPDFVAKKLVQLLIQKGKNPKNAKVLIKGVTFKEDVSDIRNSKVIDLARSLMEYSVHVHLSDPNASPNELAREYNMTLVDQISDNYDAVVVAVAHREYRTLDQNYFIQLMNTSPILFDLKALYGSQAQDSEITYWRL
jgi:UDP-N-acetyl-D-galactosamine dehydrogenase